MYAGAAWRVWKEGTGHLLLKQEMIISYFFIAMDKHVGQNYKIESTKMKKIKKKIKTKFTK